MTNLIQIRKDLPSATVRLNADGNANALTVDMIGALRQAFEDLHGERKVRAVIVTGSDTVFCSGTDLKALGDAIGNLATPKLPDIQREWERESRACLELLVELLRFPKPVIAAVNGVASGTGLALAMACDFVIGGESAGLEVSEVRRGLMPGFTIPLLAFRAGNGVARRLALSGHRVDATEGLRVGIVDEVVDDDRVWARAHQLAGELAAAAPSSQQLAKQLCNETIGEALLTQLANGAANMAAARFTESANRGVEAFRQKTEPDWFA